VGRVDYTMAPAIERFTERLLEAGRVRSLAFDLTAATLLDSTNLGLIARLAERTRAVERGRPVIVSSNEDVTSVLSSMGFGEAFTIVPRDASLAVADLEEPIITGPPSKAELRDTMLAAHRTLAALSDKDRAELEAVVAMLEAEPQHH
jgi:anti-anti-sigma factor